MGDSQTRPVTTRGAGAALRRALVLNAGAFLLVVGAGEAVTRSLPTGPALPSNISYEPGRTFRYSSPPRGTEGTREFDVEITLNRYGFHGPDHPPRRKAGTRRVALVGDSMVEGFQVRREDGLAAKLEEHLPGTEVLNFGRSGHSTMRQERLLKRIPDLLADGGAADLPEVAVFVIHGPYALRQTLVDFVRAPALWRRGLAWGLRHYTGPSRFLLVARDAVLQALVAPPQDLLQEAARGFEPGYRSDLLDGAWTLLDGAVSGLALDARALGMRPVFVYIPDYSEMGATRPDHDPLAIARRFEGMAAKAGVDWIDLSGRFREAAGPDGGGCFLKFDHHLSEKGHALAARLLAERLAPLMKEQPVVK